jgi:hypothetical protein
MNRKNILLLFFLVASSCLEARNIWFILGGLKHDGTQSLGLYGSIIDRLKDKFSKEDLCICFSWSGLALFKNLEEDARRLTDEIEAFGLNDTIYIMTHSGGAYLAGIVFLELEKRNSLHRVEKAFFIGWMIFEHKAFSSLYIKEIYNISFENDILRLAGGLCPKYILNQNNIYNISLLSDKQVNHFAAYDNQRIADVILHIDEIKKQEYISYVNIAKEDVEVEWKIPQKGFLPPPSFGLYTIGLSQYTQKFISTKKSSDNMLQMVSKARDFLFKSFN